MANRLTKLKNGHWVIESTSPLPISLIRKHMAFVDDSGKTRKVLEVVDIPDPHPEAPYYFFVEVIAAD
jgi:hypothetical protein